MKTSLFIAFSISIGVTSCSQTSQKSKPKSEANCYCDTLKVEQDIKRTKFNRIDKFDTSSFSKENFYELDASDNRKLWYRDVENPDTTKFTNLWNDYAPNNYHASHLDFIKNYENKKNIELSFQLGPNEDLWAYHIFVVKQINCCFLITHSYFRHARFTYKSYAIAGSKTIDSLYSVIGNLNTTPIDSTETFEYCGYFMDNRNKKKFYLNFNKEISKVKNNQGAFEEESKRKVKLFYEFIDKKIIWTETYSL